MQKQRPKEGEEEEKDNRKPKQLQVVNTSYSYASELIKHR